MAVLAYVDESGDDGLAKNYSSPIFVLTTTYMKDIDWDNNYEQIKKYRLYLKDNFGFSVIEEFHTADFFTDKKPYRDYKLNSEQRKNIIMTYCQVIASMNLRIINTIIDKDKVIRIKEYPVLKNALTYTIQRLENDSDWKYMIISDKGRVSIMRKTARLLKNENPISSHFTPGVYNAPIKNMIEDIMEKDSKESFFIQISDFVSYIVNLYYKHYVQKKEIPKRISSWLTIEDIIVMMDILKSVFNLKASSQNDYGLVIYPK